MKSEPQGSLAAILRAARQDKEAAKLCEKTPPKVPAKAPRSSPQPSTTKSQKREAAAPKATQGNSEEQKKERTKREKVPMKDSPRADIETCSLPDAYYNKEGKDYMFRKPDGEKFTPMNETSMKRELAIMGFSKGTSRDSPVSEVDLFMSRIQLEHGVDYVGPLAGYDVGFHQNGGTNFLVTNSPKLIIPAPGEWPLLHQVFSVMFFLEEGRDEREQWMQNDCFLAWLKAAFEGVNRPRGGSPCVGQALVLVGHGGAGKSLLQLLINVCLNGHPKHYGEPYDYLTGQTRFNEDLFKYPHMLIDDRPTLKNRRERESFTQGIKNIVNPHSKRLEGKFDDAIMVPIIWRLSIAMNETDENLNGFLQLGEGVDDKLMIFKMNPSARPMPMPADTDDEKELFFAALVKELPHLLYDLQAWEVPEYLLGDKSSERRFGVKSYHHPEIYAKMRGHSDPLELLSVIDECFDTLSSEGTLVTSAASLYNALGTFGAKVLPALAPNLLVFTKLLEHLDSACHHRVVKIPATKDTATQWCLIRKTAKLCGEVGHE